MRCRAIRTVPRGLALDGVFHCYWPSPTPIPHLPAMSVYEAGATPFFHAEGPPALWGAPVDLLPSVPASWSPSGRSPPGTVPSLPRRASQMMPLMDRVGQLGRWAAHCTPSCTGKLLTLGQDTSHKLTSLLLTWANGLAARRAGAPRENPAGFSVISSVHPEGRAVSPTVRPDLPPGSGHWGRKCWEAP